jgi:calcyphosin
MNQTR